MADLIIENLCDSKYSYRATPVPIQDEEYTIESDIPYSISLKEKPSPDHSVTVSGYNESDSAPSVATAFYIDYDASLIYFFSTEAGKEVLVTYYGTGSPLIAGDVDRFSLFLDRLYKILFSFSVEALSGCRVRIYGGKFVNSATVNTKKELFMDFGTNGNFQLSSMSAGYFKKLLIGIDVSVPQIAVIEGGETPEREAALIPSYTSVFRPVAIVTVSEDNGSISDIAQSDIISVRNCLSN